MFYSVVDSFGNFSAAEQMCMKHIMTRSDFPSTMNSYHIDRFRMVAVYNWHLCIQHRAVLYPHQAILRVYDRLNGDERILVMNFCKLYRINNNVISY